MTLRNSMERYGTLSVGLHWLMLILIAAVYALMEFRGNFPKGSEVREAMKMWHYILGLAVMGLCVIRIIVIMIGPFPQIVPALPKWQSMGANVMKLALYGLMLGLPILGWLLLSAGGKPILLLGLQLPSLINENKETADLIKEIHETGASIGYFLIGLHAVAGLYHHYVAKDNTLKRMMFRK